MFKCGLYNQKHGVTFICNQDLRTSPVSMAMTSVSYNTLQKYIAHYKREHALNLYTTITIIIIHQTHYENSDWSRAFNQFTIACELDMINVLSAADNAFIMSSSTSAWLLSLLECSPQKQNG